MLGSRVRAPEGAQKTRRQPGLYIEKRGYSSVGLERLLDRQEVTGSNPVVLTPKDLNFRIQVFFCGLFIRFGLQARGRQVKPPIDLRLIGILLHRTSLCSA